MNNFLVIICFLLYYFFLPIYAQDYWEQTNGPEGGNITSLFADESGIVIAGSRYGSIFTSSDLGSNWKYQISSNFHSEISSITKSEYFFAGTYGDGIYCSTDLGNSWIQVNNGLSEMNIFSIVVDSNGWLYAGHPNFYLSRSTDFGQTWMEMNNGLMHNCIYELDIDPSGNILAATNGGLYKSTDNAESWDFVYSDQYLTEILHLSINSIGYIYAGNNGGLYRSIDGGLNWSRLLTGTFPDQIFAVSINDNDDIFVGNNQGILRSNNYGDSWDIINPILFGSYLPLPNAFTFLSNEIVVAGLAAQGIYISSNNGETWIERNQGINAFSILSMGISNNGILVAGISNGAQLFLSSDKGDSWYQSILDSLSGGVFCTASIDSKIFVGTDQNIYCSEDNGNTWVPKDSGLIWRNIHALLYNERTKTLFAGSSRGIYHSTNEGDNWIWSGLTGRKVSDLVITDDNEIYASAGDEYTWSIYRSTNNGEDWTQTSLVGIGISSLQVNKQGDIFANYFSFYQRGVFRSTDQGSTWFHSNYGLTDSTTIRIIIDSKGSIFVSTSSDGIFRSDDSGEKWYRWNNGLGNKTIYSFVIDNDDFVYGGTRGNSVFRTINPTTSVYSDEYNQPRIFLLYQNYPNPFNPSTIISYSIKEAGQVTLKVYDILGTEVAQIVNERKSAGSYSVTFNASNLPSGIYLYELRTEGFVQTKKMILMK